MGYNDIYAAVKDLPEDKLKELMNFIEFLKYQITENRTDASKPEPFSRPLGIMTGKITMAEDFDEIPEGFEDYI